jgi:hypothetical protein
MDHSVIDRRDEKAAGGKAVNGRSKGELRVYLPLRGISVSTRGDLIDKV